MTEDQFNVLTGLLGLAESDKQAAHGVVFGEALSSPATERTVQRLRQADAQIRAAYVTHGPMEFRIEVGHRDTHRAPGALALAIGDTVRLRARSTERWVPVRITALPCRPLGYYRGVVTEQLAVGSHYSVGDGVEFSEDQVMSDAACTVRGLRRRRL